MAIPPNHPNPYQTPEATSRTLAPDVRRRRYEPLPILWPVDLAEQASALNELRNNADFSNISFGRSNNLPGNGLSSLQESRQLSPFVLGSPITTPPTTPPTASLATAFIDRQLANVQEVLRMHRHASRQRTDEMIDEENKKAEFEADTKEIQGDRKRPRLETPPSSP